MSPNHGERNDSRWAAKHPRCHTAVGAPSLFNPCHAWASELVGATLVPQRALRTCRGFRITPGQAKGATRARGGLKLTEVVDSLGLPNRGDHL